MAASDFDGLSSILGWISIACWVVVFTPQIVENYHLKSGEGLSVAFVATFLLGDLCNLVGASLAGLLPTVILLALYYVVCDIILLFQIYFYRWTNTRPLAVSAVVETSPLLDLTRDHNMQEKKLSAKRLLSQYAAAVLFVCAAGTAAWWINKGAQREERKPKHRTLADGLERTIQLLGWTSASLYLGARIPQIFKNFATRCEGLSPLLFLFGIFGNITYILSICVASMDRIYLVTNASWLVGSALAVILDVAVLGQFWYYRSIDSAQRIPTS